MPINACVVWDKKEDEYFVFVTTDTTKSAREIILTYELRPEIEEDYRQLKDFWKIEDFKSTKLNVILFHIVCVLFGYLFYQLYTLLPEGEKYLGKSLPIVLKNYVSQVQPYVVLYVGYEFGVLTLFELMELYAQSPENVRKLFENIFELGEKVMKRIIILLICIIMCLTACQEDISIKPLKKKHIVNNSNVQYLSDETIECIEQTIPLTIEWYNEIIEAQNDYRKKYNIEEKSIIIVPSNKLFDKEITTLLGNIVITQLHTSSSIKNNQLTESETQNINPIFEVYTKRGHVFSAEKTEHKKYIDYSKNNTFSENSEDYCLIALDDWKEIQKQILKAKSYYYNE